MKKIIVLITLISMLSGCKKDIIEETFDVNKEVAVSLCFKVSGDSVGYADKLATRALTDAELEAKIDNLWSFQFDGTSDNSLFVGKPNYVTNIDAGTLRTVVPMVDSEGASHRVVFIANTYDPNKDWKLTPDVSTYADLLKAFSSVQTTDGTFGTDAGMIMSGKTEAVINGAYASTIPDIWLTRSVAKGELTLELDASLTGYSVVSVQLKSVPQYLNYTDVLQKPTSLAAPYPDPSTTAFYDYPPITDVTKLPTPGPANAKTFRWYMPRNMQGTVVNTLKSNKTAMKPVGATQIVITIKDNAGVYSVFTICPGENLVNDFNIIPNHHYSLYLKIMGRGDSSTDSRVEDYGNVSFVGKALSNSYILNPPPSGSAARTYTIPVAQVARFWNDPQYVGAGNTLNIESPWSVKLYWMDTQGQVVASGTNDITISKATGTGKDDVFRLTVPSTSKVGNFTVALTRDDAPTKILWTWHFWVTDYNPYYKGVPVKNTYAYNVTGGQVHRYEGTPWATGGELATKFIMDRNLGALASNVSLGVGRGSFTYQFGRKDPFPGNVTLYNLNGPLTTSTNPIWTIGPTTQLSSATTTMDWTVQNPLVYIRSSGGQYIGGPLYDRTGAVAQTTYDDGTNNVRLRTWHDPKIASTDIGINTKSIFDPCPQGWKIPRDGTFSDFRANNATNPTTNAGSSTTTPVRGFPYWGTTPYGNGLHYWPYIIKGQTVPVSGVIFYPEVYYRRISDGGTIINTQYWLSTPANSVLGNEFYFYSGGITPASNPRGYGFALRCVQE